MKLPNLSSLKGLAVIGKTFLSTHRPEILLGTSIATTIGGVIASGRAGYKSGQQVMAAEHPSFDFEQKTDVLDVKEKIQLTWMNYLPAAGLTAGALGSTTALHLVHVKEKKALVTAGLAALEEVKQEFKEYEKDNIGVVSNEEKQEILEKRADPEGGRGQFAHVQNFDHEVEELYLVRDLRTGRDIYSNKRRIEDAVLELNNVLSPAGSGNCELNHFYRHAGFTMVPDGTTVGWSGCFVELEWDKTVRDDGRPVRTFEFRPKPSEGFDSAN